MAKMTVSFTIDDATDKDIARWLKQFGRGERSEAIRDTLRTGLGRGGVTLGDVYQAVKGLERKLSSGAAIVGSEPGPELDEPPEAAANLDALAAMG
jgi:hypothetical protein